MGGIGVSQHILTEQRNGVFRKMVRATFRSLLLNLRESTAGGNLFLGTKSYSRFGGRWRKGRWIDDVHYPLQDRDNGRFVNFEPLFQFLFQSSKLPGQFTLVAQGRSHSQERADNKHIDSRPPDRSPVSQTGNAVYPTASPHVVFIWTARGLLRTLAAMMAPCSVNA